MDTVKTEYKDDTQFFSAEFRRQLGVAIQGIEKEYLITPCKAGLFGSRAKGYATPESDFDLYVPYVAPADLYLKAFDVNTCQIDGDPVVPAQVTIDIVEDGKTFKVQLNFEPLDHFMRELSKSNLDFRMAVINTVDSYYGKSIFPIFNELLLLNFDLEKIKQVSLRRASAAVHALRNNNEISLSEVIDGIYRLLITANATSKQNELVTTLGKSETVSSLLADYVAEFGLDNQLVYVVDTVLEARQQGATTMPVAWHNHYLSVMDRLIQEIKARPVVRTTEKDHDRSIDSKLKLVSKANAKFAYLVLVNHKGLQYSGDFEDWHKRRVKGKT